MSLTVIMIESKSQGIKFASSYYLILHLVTAHSQRFIIADTPRNLRVIANRMNFKSLIMKRLIVGRHLLKHLCSSRFYPTETSSGQGEGMEGAVLSLVQLHSRFIETA